LSTNAATSKALAASDASFKRQVAQISLIPVRKNFKKSVINDSLAREGWPDFCWAANALTLHEKALFCRRGCLLISKVVSLGAKP
jgi:hypothetical protein